MCGIAGIVSFKKEIDSELINRMTDIIHYRGPDDEGAVKIDNRNSIMTSFRKCSELSPENRKGKIFFGNRRLSIIDLSPDGHMPMSYNNNKLWITYNGEIYNYIELREELKCSGYEFKSKTDTEVILAAYHKWGEDCVRRFNGMWSFAIFDSENKRIFCSCDRLGIKPFYYYSCDDGIYFGSEIKQLLELPFIERKTNNSFLLYYLIIGSSTDFNDSTLYSKIKRLRPGYNLIIENLSSQNPEINLSKWYEFDTFPKEQAASDKQLTDNFYELLYDSVKLRMRSDVPVGTALSGGLDSSTLVFIMDRILKDTSDNYVQKTFTVGSEIDEINESKYADEVLKLTNAKGYYVTPTSEGLFQELNNLLYHLEDPFPSTSCYASWCVYKLAKQSGVTVTLDGQGPDELLGGYEKYVFPSFNLELFMQGYFREFFSSIKEIKNLYGLKRHEQIKDMAKEVSKQTGLMDLRYKYRIKHNNLIKKEFACSLVLDEYLYSEYIKKNSFYSNIKNAYSNLQKNYYYVLSLQALLRIVDRNSMAHSVEARVPFLDYRLIEYIFSLPHHHKIKRGVTKYILRKSMEDKLPETILKRKKIGFVTDEKNWFRQKKGTLKEIIYSKKYRLKDILINNNIESIVDSDNSHGRISENIWKIIVILQLMDIFNLTI